MENKLYSVRDIAQETGYSAVWITKLIDKLKLKPIISPRGESGGTYEYFLTEEEARKIRNYAKKHKAIEEKRSKLRAV